MTTIYKFPKQTIGAYDVVVMPLTAGRSLQSAYIYQAGTRQVVWECMAETTINKAFASAKKWIREQAKREA